MTVIEAGDIWILRVDDELRSVKVIAGAGMLGWWRCVDLVTDIQILARYDRFIERQVKVRDTRSKIAA